MKVVTSAQMREIDRRTIEEHGIPADELMLAAARAIADVVRQRFTPQHVAIVCGKGNNAGDGFVVAHELTCDGIEVDVICMERLESYTGPAAVALQRIIGTRLQLHPFGKGAAALLSRSEVIVDALLGTGIRGALQGQYAEAVALINAAARPVVCADIPSGLADGNMEADAPVVHANITVTIGAPKLSLFTEHGLEHTGELVVAPIQFPPGLLEDPAIALNWDDSHQLATWLPKRHIGSNKGSYGHVGLIAGSAQYAGAAILLARAALRAGCGLVTIFCPAELNAIYKIALPEAITAIVPSTDGQSLDASSADAIVAKCERLSVLAIGPGLGTSDGQQQLLSRILELQKPVVLDADAITMIARNQTLQPRLRNVPDCVLTPHPGEMARLLGNTVADVQSDRQTALSQAVTQLGATVLLKGAGTLIGRADGQQWILRGGTSALAKGGTGDVLTGVIASLMAQGMPGWQAAVIGATAHVQAGQLFARTHGERGVLASEVADAVPVVMDKWISAQRSRSTKLHSGETDAHR